MKNFPFNIVSANQTVIGMQEYELRKPLDRIRNAAGRYTTDFAEPIPMRGSVQPVNVKQYIQMGLDFKKAYIKIYDANLIEGLSRTTNADQVIYDGYLWSVAEDTPWFMAGGWTYVVCVRLELYKEPL